MGLLLEDEADYVVVGTGAGGATAARVLSEAGCSVLLLEEGPRLATARPRRLVDAMGLAMRDFGGQTTAGMTPMPLLQGCCVGGSTALNSGIIWRMPEDVRDEWAGSHGLAELVDPSAMERIYEQLERELEVEMTSEEIYGGNNGLMARASEILGLPGKPTTRNAARCKGRSRCLQGCPGEARQSMDVSYIPRALQRGARLHPLCRASKVMVKGGRAIGVTGDVLDPDDKSPRGRFRVHARRAVVLSAGALHTPVLLQRSGVKGLAGERFQAHPGLAMVGRFPEKVGMSFGATQGYEIPMRARRFKLEALTLPPEMLAARLPGVGADWQERLSALDHMAQWCGQMRMRAHGSVRPGWGARPVVRYEPLPSDLEIAHEMAVLLVRMMFAAGAVEVYPGIGGVPEVLNDPSQVHLLEHVQVRRGDFHLVASHLFGTACAGADPARSVVGPDLRCHAVDGLYVMDASVFPTNMGVNPQHSIMAVVWRAAERLAAAHRVAA